MQRAGFASQISIDISKTVTEQMERRWHHLDCCSWQVMDATAMKFTAGAFGSVIEKGTLDALSTAGRDAGLQMLREIHRVLTPEGKLLLISSQDRRSFLQDSQFEVSVEVIQGRGKYAQTYYGHVCCPKPGAH